MNKVIYVLLITATIIGAVLRVEWLYLLTSVALLFMGVWRLFVVLFPLSKEEIEEMKRNSHSSGSES